MSNRSRALGVLTAALLLAGCVDTPPTDPQVAQIAPAALGLGAQTAPEVGEGWWKAFGDPQVDRLAAAMLKDNPTLAAALARIRGAQAELASNEARDLPQVSLDGR